MSLNWGDKFFLASMSGHGCGFLIATIIGFIIGIAILAGVYFAFR